MRLSTKVRYAQRVMICLAMQYGMGPVLLRDISEAEDISEKYLWNIIQPLKAAGLIGSLRGAQGGYFLKRPPQEITLADIIEVMEGSFSLIDCVENPTSCSRSSSCISREIWKEAADNIKQILEHLTLERVIERKNELDSLYTGHPWC